jgi:N-acetylneuraminate lyase
MNQELTGLIAAPFTAFHADGSLNLAMIERQAEALRENRVDGAFVCGTTGEGLSLTAAERRQVLERWVEVAPVSLRLLVHVGHHSVRESQALAAHAEKLKICAFATSAPTFFRVTSTEQLVNYCDKVAAGAPGLPFYYYHIPSMTGTDLPVFDFLRIASKRIPNLAGIKFTHENLMDYSRCLEFEEGRFNILFGRDEMLLSALIMGATGAIGSTYNFMAPVYHRVIEAFQAGDLASARRYQFDALRIIGVIARYGILPAGKVIMKMLGIDCGPLRSPLQNLPTESAQTLERELRATGFPVAPLTAAERREEAAIKMLARR